MGLPVISGLSRDIMALERRRDYCKRQIEEQRGSASALKFSESEAKALSGAIDALTYHRAIVNGSDTFLSILREIIEGYSENKKIEPELFSRAKIVLDEYGG